MKKQSLFLLGISALLLACNNQPKDSVEKADSINKVRTDSSSSAHTPITTDEESSKFLVKAANGGMAEVKMGELAQKNGQSQNVLSFGNMMIKDHADANEKIKALAAERNVSLPAAMGEEEMKMMADLSKKQGKVFDKAYTNAMVEDHQKDIKEFKEAYDKVKDGGVKDFINNTLPVLQKHLDSIKSIHKILN